MSDIAKGLFVAAALLLTACPQSNDRPDVACADECKVQLSSSCRSNDCERGCAFVLDRLVEHEQTTILSCMKTRATCDDPTWADCAVRVGPHADGGPGVPAPSTPQEP